MSQQKGWGRVLLTLISDGCTRLIYGNDKFAFTICFFTSEEKVSYIFQTKELTVFKKAARNCVYTVSASPSCS
jgi:hypothetical protein